VVAVLHDDVLTRIEAPTPRDGRAEELQLRSDMLLASLDWDRERLFELRSLLMLRLHRASDDFGATEGLRVVERSISRISREDAPLPAR
jgi:hypothetical protein